MKVETGAQELVTEAYQSRRGQTNIAEFSLHIIQLNTIFSNSDTTIQTIGLIGNLGITHNTLQHPVQMLPAKKHLNISAYTSGVKGEVFFKMLSSTPILPTSCSRQSG